MKALSLLLVSFTLALAANVQAADQSRDRTQTRDPSTHTTQTQQQAREQVYGWELMSEQERMEHQNKMRSLKTEQEREAYRQEHHKLMQDRAKAQGKAVPDMPQGRGPAAGSGMGQGQGPKR